VTEVDWLLLIETMHGKDGRLELTILSKEGERRTETVAREAFLRWSLGGAIFWDGYALRVGTLESRCPLESSGVAVSDVITNVDGEACYDEDLMADILSKKEEPKAAVTVIRGGTPVVLSIDRDLLKKPEGVTWQSMPPIAAVLRGGPAERAGVIPGSRFIRFGQENVYSWNDMLRKVDATKVGTQVTATWVEPGGTERQATLTVGVAPAEFAEVPLEFVKKTIQAGPIDSFALGARRTVVVSKQVLLTLRSLVRRDVSAKNLAGPVGIVHQFTVVIEKKELSMLLYWLALISINLGLFNLFPFPILDGGHLLFLAIEKIKGSPVDVRVQEWAINIAFFLILFLALFVTFNDVRRLFH